MRTFQKYLPTIFGSICCLLIALCYKKFGIGENYKDLLSAAIVFASILVGLIGVLMGTLFGVRNDERVKLFLSYTREEIKGLFKSSIIAGLSLVILSMMLYVSWTKPFEVIVFLTWSFSLGYSFSSMYRVFDIVLHIVFSDTGLNDDEPAESIMQDRDRENLQKNFERKKNN
ncbi:MAG: hypothetical protein HFE72_10380 [Emergencia sp.]|nr:hypothetical protein [Emergencia sp.]